MIYTLLLPDDTLLSFSSVTEFSESYSANITSYETQVGFPITDNMVLNNPTFSMSAILSYYNSPTREILLVDGQFQVVDNSDVDTPIENQIELEGKVKRLWSEKIPFSIIKSTNLNDILGSELERYESCLLANLELPQTSGVSGAIFPKLSITKIRLTTVIEEEVPNASPNLIAKSQVATKEEVKAAEDTKAVAPDGGKPDEPSSINGERTGTEENKLAAHQKRTEAQGLKSYEGKQKEAIASNEKSQGENYKFVDFHNGQPTVVTHGRPTETGTTIPFRNQ